MKKIILLVAALTTFISTNAQNGLSFDGLDDKILVGNPTNLNLSGTNLTVEAWVYPTGWAPLVWQGNVVNQENNSTDDGFMLRIGENGKINFGYGYAGSGWNEINTSANTLLLNTWAHVAATFDGSYVRIYKDGISIDSIAYSQPMVAGNVDLNIGARNVDRFFQGSIDEVRVWSVARTKAQINQSMNDEFCGATPGLELYYKLNQGVAGGINTSIVNAIDNSGNGFDGTLSGFGLNGSSSNFIQGKNLNKPTGVTASVTDTLCKKTIYHLGNKILSEPGVYKDTLQTAFGCDSILTLNLVGDSVDASASYVGFDFVVNNANATSYQWYKCGLNFILNGETNQTFSPTDNDYYACIVREGNCVDTTTCMSLVFIGLEENVLNQVQLYPNPSNGQFSVKGLPKNTNFELYNTAGKLLQKGSLKQEMNFTDLESGIYLINLLTDGYIKPMQLIIH